MELIFAIITVVLLGALLDFAKLNWHGIHSQTFWCVFYLVVHICSATALTAWFFNQVGLPESYSSVALVTVITHFALIDLKREGRFIGKLLSFLSSWPWQILGLYTLGWYALIAGPILGCINLMMWMDVVRVWTGNEKYRLRPKHWTPSFWEDLVM